MQEQTFTFENEAGQHVYVYSWSPSDPGTPLRGVIQIAHGMSETAERYSRFAETLTKEGFLVYANDHRGHGRTASSPDELGWPGQDGLNGMVRDIITLGELIHDRHSEFPLFLMGHSMGSFLTQKTMYTRPERYRGFILSGTNGPRGLLSFGQNLARFQARLQGPEHASLLLNALSFGSFNKNFMPMRTPFDWLSRDEQEVDKFVKHPLCGFVCSSGFFHGLFGLLREIHRPDRMSLIPKDKPVYIFGGDQDPVGLEGKGVLRLLSLYERLGLQDLEFKLYPGGRHEMLNELNRDEVTRDTADWLKRQLPS
ncbi:alpha-beta hydrolase superfamily lysophospholipase [Fontibacillus phaseoli]|uniref:Alpha-beta hydrolase superfamily lysophospholipase n=1 Tax=Fontibacillus phaseoli TaxID=1416533 RepID=A0A369BIP7_9BACL|nr:alpha/beta hydrolase [Fontibacillus phaseoli]RCX20307.1 alpha-beta hydrolase superfamily lysophospholipase [Fontibacillus phaseoli]